MTDAELDELEALAQERRRIYLPGQQNHQTACDMLRLIAEVRALRGENEKLRYTIKTLQMIHKDDYSYDDSGDVWLA